MMSARRIHIVGGQGTGKTTLATRIGTMTGLPVHELDLVARVGGGNGPERPVTERDALVAAIVATERWVTEGVQLGWTRPLFERADLIVWLDHVSPGQASGRMIRRFVRDGWTEMRARHGRERFLRLRDYARHGRDLVVAVWRRGGAPDRDVYGTAVAGDMDRVVRCRTAEDVETLIRDLAATQADASVPERAA